MILKGTKIIKKTKKKVVNINTTIKIKYDIKKNNNIDYNGKLEIYIMKNNKKINNIIIIGNNIFEKLAKVLEKNEELYKELSFFVGNINKTNSKIISKSILNYILNNEL